MPSLGNGALLAERREMKAHRIAIMQVLVSRPVTDSPTLAALYPDAPDLFAAIYLYRDTLQPSHPLRMAVDHIIQFIRLHADAMGIQSFLGVSDAWMDDLFRDAMAIEAATS